MRPAALALPLLLPLAAAAQAPAQPAWRAALVAEHSNLDRGNADWDAVTLQLGRHWSRRQLAEVELTETRRFGLRDTELAVSGALPLADTVTASVRASHSPTHRVLARSSVAGALQYEFRPAWLLHAGLKNTRYTDTSVDQASVMLEHYFGNWSVLGAVHAARAFGQDTRAAEVRGTWYYGDASSVGLIAGAGDEAAQVAPGTVAIARVRSLALVGRHALDGTWSVRWGLHRVRQGSFHTRSGAALGVQAVF